MRGTPDEMYLQTRPLQPPASVGYCRLLSLSSLGEDRRKRLNGRHEPVKSREHQPCRCAMFWMSLCNARQCSRRRTSHIYQFRSELQLHKFCTTTSKRGRRTPASRRDTEVEGSLAPQVGWQAEWLIRLGFIRRVCRKCLHKTHPL